MNHVLYIIPILLAVTIPSAFAQVETTTGQNYDTVTNDDGSTTWTSHPERILINDTWQNYFLETTNQKIIFTSNSIGGFVYDIPSCSYSLYENGFEGSQIIPSVSIVGTQNNNGIWENLAVNEESCKVDFSQDEKGIIITSTKENNIQKLTHEIIVNINIGVKETFKLWDESGNELGISQTVHTGDSIKINDQTIDIAQFNGQSFDRDFIVENKAEILQMANNLNYDFDVGIDSLSNVNIIFDESYKVNMDYANGNFTNYLEIDPTFGYTDGTWKRYYSDLSQGQSSCATRSVAGADTNNQGILRSENTGGRCQVYTVHSDISSLPTSGLVVSSANIQFTVSSVSSPNGLDVFAVTNNPSTSTNSAVWTDIFNGNQYVDDSTTGDSTGSKTLDLGTTAKSDIASLRGSNNNDFTFSLVQGNWDNISGTSETTLNLSSSSVALEIVYSTATAPSAISDLSASFNSPNVDLSFSTPSDGGSAITSFKVYRDTGSGYSLYDTVSGSSLTSYQDTNPTLGAINYYKINAVNSIGEASDSNVASVFAGIPPDAPTGLTSTIQDANNSPLDVYLQWSSPTNVGSGTLTGFEVYRNGVLITTIGLVNSYTDSVTQGSHSHYVKAVSTHGTSGNSNTVNITTPDVPDSITDLSGNVISDTQINVTWTAPNDGGSNIDLYKIFKDGSQVDTTTNTNYSLTGLSSNTAYTITVYANSSVGDSLVSNTVNLTTYQSVSGSITVTPNTQGASTQLTFSASGVSGTPTPTFNTFTLKEGITVIASGITSPYTLSLNDNSPHTYTVTSTDNTHWNTPTIQGSTTVTASYDPNWSNGVSYNYTRASGVMDLTVNQNTQSLWDATCNYKTTAQVMADQSGIISNHTGVWYINDSQNIADIDTVYVSCSDDGTTLFSFTSFGPNRLGGGIAQLDDVFGDMTGTPVALIFVLLVAGLFTGRSAPTGILLVLALIGVLGFIGMLTIDEAVWGFLLLAGVLGIFLGKRFL